MCGFGVEIRPGGAPTATALERMGAALAPRGPDGAGLWIDGRRRDGPPAAGDHRPLRARRAADARRGARPDDRLQRLHLQPPRAARASSSAPATRSPRPATPRCCSRAGREWGEGCSTASPACSRSACARTQRARRARPRPAGRSSRCTWPSCRAAALRAASTLPALLRAGGVDTRVDPVALHHYLSWHSVVPAPRTILRGVRKLPPATLLVIEPDGRRRERALLGPAVRARPGAPTGRRTTGRRGARGAARRRAAADGGRRAGRDPALGRAGLEPDRRAARRAGPARPGHVLDRLPGRRRARGRRVRVLRPRRARVRDRAPSDPGRRAERIVDALPAAIARDERADGLPRRGRVLAALGGGRARAQGRAVRPGRRRGARRLLLVPAAARGAGQRAGRPTPPRSSTATTPACARCSRRRAPTRTSRGRSPPSGSSGRAPTPPVDRGAAPGHRGDARRRPRQARRQHDDGARPGGAHAVPGPRAGRARRRLPARAQARRRRQGRAQATPRAASCPTR